MELIRIFRVISFDHINRDSDSKVDRLSKMGVLQHLLL